MPRSLPRVILIPAAFGLALLGAVGVAHAFTFDDQSNTNADGSAKFSDPDSRFSNGSSGSGGNNARPTYRYGNSTLQFGTGSQRSTYDQRYNTDNMFDTNGRPYGDR